MDPAIRGSGLGVVQFRVWGFGASQTQMGRDFAACQGSCQANLGRHCVDRHRVSDSYPTRPLVVVLTSLSLDSATTCHEKASTKKNNVLLLPAVRIFDTYSNPYCSPYTNRYCHYSSPYSIRVTLLVALIGLIV